MFDSHDAITFAQEELSTRSGDVRLLPLAAVISAGVAGVEDGLGLPPLVDGTPGGWTEDERRRARVLRLPSVPAEQEQALLGSERIRAALGDPLVGAFLAVRRPDALWAAERPAEGIVAAHPWRY